MAKCAIIGGGLSGLSAAVYLSKQGHSIDLFEASPKLGGRTYSFVPSKKIIEVDNGQHLMMGAYKNTFDFLKTIGSYNLLEHQKELFIPFVTKFQKLHYLKTTNSYYPFNLLKAFSQFEVLSKSERLRAIFLFLKLLVSKNKKSKKNTAYDWLLRNNQTENSIKLFWNVISVGALNTDVKEASYQIFISTLKKIFFDGNDSAKFTFTNVPLSQLFIKPALNYLESKSVNIYLSERLISFQRGQNSLYEIITNKRTLSGYDFLVLAIPIFNILVFRQFIHIKDLFEFKTSPIITVHIFLKRNVFHYKFYGFVDSKIHWLFNNQTHVSLVISSAEELVNKSSEEIIEISLKEIENHFNTFTRVDVTDAIVLKEKRATIKAKTQLENFKEYFNFYDDNLYIAGDWTLKNYPSTIESAILSGKITAENINKNF